MYYEEQWIDGELCWRSSPDGTWTAYTAYELGHRYQGELKRARDAQATVEALRRERDALKIGLNALRDAYDELESRHNDTTATLDAERETNKALVERISKLEGK